MNKKLFLSAWALFACSMGFAQWTDNGSTTYTNDNVSIGTSTPPASYPLYVDGTTYIDNGSLTVESYQGQLFLFSGGVGGGPGGGGGSSSIGIKMSSSRTGMNISERYSWNSSGSEYWGEIDYNNNELLYINEAGKIGIGTTELETNAEITTNGDFYIKEGGLTVENDISMLLTFNGGASGGPGGGGGASVLRVSSSSSRPGIKVSESFSWTTGNPTTYRGVISYNNQGIINLSEDGQAAIGTTNFHDDYKLAVEGGIITDELLIADNGSTLWPDYVFEEDYDLKPLEDVDQYIEENKHLPDVPSAAEIEEKGVNVLDMNAVLLRKIEELTLYVIDLKKDNDALKAEVETLKQ